MMKTIAALLFSAVLVVTANAQGMAGMNVCTEQEQMAVFADLGLDGLTCGLSLRTASSNDTFGTETSDGVNATRAVCTGDCIGTLAQGILCQCNQFDAEGLRGFCYRSTGRITFCRESYDGVVNPIITGAVAGVCLPNFTGTECPAGCPAALQGLVDEIGCCYQTIYNNSVLTAPLPAEMQDFFTGLNNALLWNICNVTIPDLCPEPEGIAALDAAACPTAPPTTPDSAPGLLATKAVAVFLLLLAYFAIY